MSDEPREPLVTIVTATFNLIQNGRERSFRQCVESVHNQTYKKIEHIIVDGASRDGTLDLIKEYATKGWIKYLSEPDNGIYDAMNKGTELGKGKYIAFLNSDDHYHDKIGVATSVSALEKSNAAFSYAPAIVKFEDGRLFKEHPICSPKIHNVFFTMPFCHQTMFTRRDIMIKESMFDTNYKTAADYDLVVRLCLKKYKSVFVNNTFVTFLFAGVSSKEQGNSLKETIEIWRKSYKELCPMTDGVLEAMRKNIYTGNYYNGVPHELVKQLKKFKPYFNYREHLKGLTKKMAYLWLDKFR